MIDFRQPTGFEDALRPPVDVRRARLTPAVLRTGSVVSGGDARSRLERVARRAPEVMVKITGRTRDGSHLLRHLDYISRNGKLPLEGPDGERLQGRAEVRALADDWTAELAAEHRRRDSPMSLSIILSMPAGTDPHRLHDASRAFASAVFGDRHPYVFALHTDDRHPHVHLTVRALGQDGVRLNPRKADLQVWRETFAAALRARSIEAEATPRRARGVVRKPERTAVRKLRERFEAGGSAPETLRGALRDAASDKPVERPWEATIQKRQARIRRALVAETLRLGASSSSENRALARDLEGFIRAMPAVATRRQILAQALDVSREPSPPRRSRSR